jgi:prepilin-type N-terminal cleavage/methylation domain-containing protein
MTARAPRRRRSDAGLTLVELMITLVVASAVASSTFVFFAGQQRIYETQTKLLNVQQNLWMSMEVMARQLRASGTGMAGCQTGLVPPGSEGVPNTGIRAWYEGVGAFRIPPIHINNGEAGAPDEITFSFFTNASGNYVDGMLSETIEMDFNGSNIKTADSTPFREGEYIILFDIRPNPPNGDRGCTMYQITGIAGNSDLAIVNPSSPWNCKGQTPPDLVPYDYLPANTGIRNLGTLTSVRYFIDSTGAPARPPRLMIDDMANPDPPQILADGVEDMQIAYACDTQPGGNPDGSLSEGTDAASRVADEWTYNQAGDVAPPSCGIPSAIRVTLLGRSLNPDQSLFGTSGSGSVSNSLKPAVEDGLAGAPDAFRHRTLTTTVYPRN